MNPLLARLAGALLFSVLACAQINTGTLVGTVSDPSGAVIPAAKVTVRNQSTGSEIVVTSNQDGLFRAPYLVPGEYTVKVEAQGFRAFEARDILISVLKETSITARLEVGAMVETLVVEANAATLETTTAQITFTVQQEKTLTLPRLNTGLDRLAFLSPGVVPGLAFQNSNGAQIAANGQRGRSNNFLLEGVDNNDTSIGGPSFFFSMVEAVQEFSIVTNQFSAEYGRNSGATVNINVRSGTNEWHGTGIWAHENDEHFTALTNFQRRVAPTNPAKLTRPPKNIFNQYGATIGGPFVRNKLFGFGFAYRDARRQNARLEATSASLTPSREALQALQQAFPNSIPVRNLIQHGPLTRDVERLQILERFPNRVSVNSPTGPVGIEMVRIVRNASQPFDRWQYGGRVDWAPNDRNRVSGRYLHQNSISPTLTLNGYHYDTPGRSYNSGGNWTRSFGATMVNDARFSWVRSGFYFQGNNTFPFSELGKNIASVSMPSGYLGFGLPTNIPQYREFDRFNFQNNFSWQLGRHGLRMGTQISQDRNEFGFLPQVNGAFVFNTWQDFVDNRPAQFNGAAGDPIQRPKQFDRFFYFQDDWRVNSRLTLNLGIRYEFSGQPLNILNDVTTKRESDPNTALWDTSLPLEQRTVPRLRADRNNFAPRIGFALSLPDNWLFGTDATVIRGGYGISYDPAFYNLLLNVQTSTPTVQLYGLGNTFPMPADITGDNLRRLAAPPRGLDPRRLNQTIFEQGFYSPYAQNWSFGVQRRIGARQTAEVRYVGTRGIGLFQTVNANPLLSNFVNNGFASLLPSGWAPGVNPACASCNGRLNPNNALLRMRANTASSVYHGLQSRFDGRIGDQLIIGASYTWSTTIDNVSEVFASLGAGSGGSVANPQSIFNWNSGERGRSNIDLPHFGSVNFVWDLPFYKSQKGFLGRLIGGWQTAGVLILQGGRALTVLQNNPPGQLSPLNDSAYNTTFFNPDQFRPFPANPNAPVRTVGILTAAGLRNYYDQTQAVSFNDVRWLLNNFALQQALGNPFGGGRNTYRGPAQQIFDLSLFKNINITENVRLQLRFESSNFPNHPNPLNPETRVDLGQAVFLNPTETESAPRRITLGMRLFF